MSPPKLARYAPITTVLQPGVPHTVMDGRNDAKLPATNSLGKRSGMSSPPPFNHTPPYLYSLGRLPFHHISHTTFITCHTHQANGSSPPLATPTSLVAPPTYATPTLFQDYRLLGHTISRTSSPDCPLHSVQ